MKELKDYLHLYLGCDAQVRRRNDKDKSYHTGVMVEITKGSNHGNWIIVRFENTVKVTSNTWDVSDSNYHHFFIKEDEIKPILRPLSDMTEQEKKEMMQQKHKYDTGNAMSHTITDHAYRIKWAISKHFDLFGLIESGLAIDKTKQP